MDNQEDKEMNYEEIEPVINELSKDMDHAKEVFKKLDKFISSNTNMHLALVEALQDLTLRVERLERVSKPKAIEPKIQEKV